MTKLSIKKFKLAVIGSRGIQNEIAKRCGVERSTITNYLTKRPELRILIEQEREKMIDIAEDELDKLIKCGSFKAIQLLLKTKGKNRGYVEKQEIEHSGGIEPITISFQLPENVEKFIKDQNNKSSDDDPKV